MRKSDSKTTQKEQQESVISTLESGKQQSCSPEVKPEEVNQCLDDASIDMNLKDVS